MRLDKLGSLISPLDVVLNGSKSMHAIGKGIVYGPDMNDPAHFAVESLDVPVVKVGAGGASLESSALLDGLNPAPVPGDSDPDVEKGFAFNIHSNMWNTNGVEWYPYDSQGQHLKFRFRINMPTLDVPVFV